MSIQDLIKEYQDLLDTRKTSDYMDYGISEETEIWLTITYETFIKKLKTIQESA